MGVEQLADRVLLPGVVDYLHEQGVKPNQITAAGLGCSLTATGLLVGSLWNRYTLPIAAVFIALALLTDALDGDLARRHDLTSNRGAFFDFTSDKVSDILVYGALTALCSVPLVGLAALAGDLLISGISAKFEALEGEYVKVGVGSRGGAHILLAIGVFATPFVAPAVEYTVAELLTGLLAVIAITKYGTVIQRLRQIYPQLT